MQGRRAARGWTSVFVVALVVALVAGADVGAAQGSSAPGAGRGRIAVVASFYPVAEAAARVGGDAVTVVNLTPAGAEPHDLELTPRQRDQIDDARVVVVMGRGFQPAVEAAAAQRDGATVELLRRLPVSGGKKLDPHVWLDPELMSRIVDEIAAAFAKAAPSRRATFERNATAYRAELAALDDEFRSGLEHCERQVIVTAHEAFGYLARAYGLRQLGVAGIAPDAEPDARRLAELADLARRQGVTTIFTETLVSPRIAETLAREAGGLRTEVLNPLEGLTAKERRAGADYESVMRANLAKLRVALGCQ